MSFLSFALRLFSFQESPWFQRGHRRADIIVESTRLAHRSPLPAIRSRQDIRPARRMIVQEFKKKLMNATAAEY
jgi:hypothetical protein